jgi:hypothetical protein
MDVAARRLPEAAIPDYPGERTGRIIAVYALHPFAATSTEPIGVRIPAEVPDGTAVRLMVVDEIDGTFAESVDAVVRNGEIVTPEGTGITRLTHLVVVRVAS